MVVTDWVLLQWQALITAVSVCHLNRFKSANYAVKLISLYLEHSGCSHINSINSSAAVWDTVAPRVASTEGVSWIIPCYEYLRKFGSIHFSLSPMLMTVL